MRGGMQMATAAGAGVAAIGGMAAGAAAIGGAAKSAVGDAASKAAGGWGQSLAHRQLT